MGLFKKKEQPFQLKPCEHIHGITPWEFYKLVEVYDRYRPEIDRPVRRIYQQKRKCLECGLEEIHEQEIN